MRDGKNEARYYTFKLLDMVMHGELDKDTVITAFASYMSDADVHQMMLANDILIEEDDDE